jgi:hypothetical protein
MEGNGDLDQALQKLFVFRRGRAPDVFQQFVGVKEFGLIKRGNSLLIFFGMHNSFWHSAKGDIASYVSTVRKFHNANWWP